MTGYRSGERPPRHIRLLALVDADPVDEHRLREDGRLVRRPDEVPPDRDIQYDEEVVVEYPVAPRRDFRLGDREVAIVVDIPGDTVPFPLDAEKVESLVEAAISQHELFPDRGAPRVSRPVKRALRYARILPAVFHDVDLAALRPADHVDIGAKQPEGRPDPLPHRQADPRLEPPARLREAPLRLDAPGRVLPPEVFLPPRDDGEVPPAVQGDVFRPVGVDMSLLI